MGSEIREEAVVVKEHNPEVPCVLDEVVIEELAVDGICGIY